MRVQSELIGHVFYTVNNVCVRNHPRRFRLRRAVPNSDWAITSYDFWWSTSCTAR